MDHLTSEFVAKLKSSITGEIKTVDRTNVLLYGHCYQKARPIAIDGLPIGVAATECVLHTVGYSVEIIDDGCCGMAGAFGYEAEPYDLSMQVGELSLIPTVKGSGISTIAACGISCKITN